MVILNRKAAEQNPASTAALRRVAINLSSQRRALRHPAGALMKATSFAVEMKKRIREEVMNGTFLQRTASRRMRNLSGNVNFRKMNFPNGHGEPCGAAAVTSGLKSGAPRESVCGRAMIFMYCRVPTTSLSLTANRNFLHDFRFVRLFKRSCAG